MQTYICYIIIYIIEAFILWLYARNVFFPKRKTFLEITVLISSYGILFFIQCLQSSWINLLAFSLVNFIYLLSLYQTTFFSALIHTCVITMSMSFGELIIVNSISHFAYNFYSHQNYFRNMVIMAIFSKMIYFLILQFIAYSILRKKETSSFYDRGIILLAITASISICFIPILAFICENVPLSDSSDFLITLSAILILIWNLLVFWYYNYSKKKNEEFVALQLQLQKEDTDAQYQKLLLQEDENQKILIHDIRKHLQTIMTLNAKGEQQKISAYISEIISSSDLQIASKTSDHELLNSILGRYFRQCQEQQISFRADIREKSIDFLSDKDITSLFCNLMDNAVTAAAMSRPSFIDLSAAYKPNACLTVITLINSCRKNPFSKITGKLQSTKSDPGKHGFGIKSIMCIVKKYDGDMETYYEDDCHLFHMIITLKQPKNI